MKLIIANKLYSSWSLRPWLVMKHFGLPFEEQIVPLDEPDTRERLLALSPSGKVPVLIDEDATVWETLAIIETLADKYPDLPLWPKDRLAKAFARAISAEMHSDFSALRSECPMNLGEQFAWRGGSDALMKDVARVTGIWQEARRRFGGEGLFLFGDFSAADAMFAPVVTRFETYSIPVDPVCRAYMDAVLNLPAFQGWRKDALQEPWTLARSQVKDAPIAVFRLCA